MKAITLHQPWASAIALGLKTIETRSWPTAYRGPLAIHAGADKSRANQREFEHLVGRHPEIYAAFARAYPGGWLSLPFGNIVATSILNACVRHGPTSWDMVDKISKIERALGNYGPGRYYWGLTGIQRVTLDGPVVIGRQGLWDYERPALTGPGSYGERLD